MFETPSLIRRVLSKIDQTDQRRSLNRSRINNLFNGEPPYTPSEAAANNIEWNFNTKQAPKVAHDGRSRYRTGVLQPRNFFTVILDEAPLHKKATYENIITKEINRIMKASRQYCHTLKESFAQVVLHGVAPVIWTDSHSWRPRTKGIYDLKIPSNTYTSFDNLEYFGAYCEFSPGELFKLTHRDRIDPGWNMKAVDAAINYCIKHTDGYQANNEVAGWFYTNPEKYWEQFRANLGYWASDVPQKILVYDFFFREVKSNKDAWQRRMILQKPLDQTTKDQNMEEVFLYKPKRTFAVSLDQILHCMYADYNNVAPFYYHSVRGMGYMLYDLLHADNRFHCKVVESGFEQLLMYFYASDPLDRDRLDQLTLKHAGFIPDGLKIVPNTERYSPNERIVQSAIAMNQSRINQNSSSFTTDAALRDDKQQTLGEWSSKLSIYNQMVSSTLADAYDDLKFQYMEICRRFCIKHSLDPDVVYFQKCCARKGLPKTYLDHKRWEISPERVLGGGNRALAIQEASAIYEVRPSLSPAGQRMAAFDYVMAVTGDPAKAELSAPLDDPNRTSDPIHDAENVFNTLMNGIEADVMNKAAHIETIETWLGMLNAVVQRAMSTGGNPSMDRVVGMQTVVDATGRHIAALAQDKAQKAKVKEYGDALGRLANQVKAFGQRAAQQNGNGMSPELQSKIQAEMVKAQSHAKIKEAAAGQRLQQREQQFESEQKRRELTTASDMAIKAAQAEQDRVLADAEAASKIRRESIEPES